MPKLPEIIAHPDAIVKMKNGRVNLYSQFNTAKGKNGIISVELNTVKDINSKYSKYNLVVTVLPAMDTYAQNNLMNNAVAVGVLSMRCTILYFFVNTHNGKEPTEKSVDTFCSQSSILYSVTAFR